MKSILLDNYEDKITEPNFESNFITFKILEEEYEQEFICDLESFFISSDNKGKKGQWYKFYAILTDIKTEDEAINFLYKKDKPWCFSLPKIAFENAMRKKRILHEELEGKKFLKLKFKKVNSKTLMILDYEFLTKLELQEMFKEEIKNE